MLESSIHARKEEKKVLESDKQATYIYPYLRCVSLATCNVNSPRIEEEEEIKDPTRSRTKTSS